MQKPFKQLRLTCLLLATWLTTMAQAQPAAVVTSTGGAGATVIAAPAPVISTGTALPAMPAATGIGAPSANAAAPAGNSALRLSPSLSLTGLPAGAAAQANNAAANNANPNAPADAANAKPAQQQDAAQQQQQQQAADNQLMAAEALKKAAASEVEFQRFVRSATGQSLGLYGYDLFAGGNNFAAVQAAPVPAGYTLGPGDEIVLQVNGVYDVNERLVIDRDGRVQVPKVGPLNLAGVALSNAEKVFTTHIGKVYRNFTVSVTMGRLRSIEVFVVGQARRPGKHLVSSMSTLINALFETGGPSANGSLRAIEVRRLGKKIATLDMYAFLSQGDNTSDVQLLAGDIIYIPPASARAAVLGTINAPAIYELLEGETINSILNLSGGLPTLAAPQKAQLERVNAKLDIARYVQDFALDEAGLALKLEAGDILTVFQVSPQIANVVTLQGNVASPLRYTFKPGMKISDLLSDKRLLIPGSYWAQINQGIAAGNYSRAEVNLDYATIQRLDPVELRTKVFAFNLAKAVALDKTENVELLSGDIVTVYKPGEVGPETENSITLAGASVGGTHRLVWREGYTVKDIAARITELFAEASRNRPARGTEVEANLYSTFQVNLGYATVKRRDPASLRSTLLSFNLGKALAGDATESIALKSRDAISIFEPGELGPETENSVSITGEIVGGTKRFVWRQGMTIKDIIPSTQWLVDYYNYWQRPNARNLKNDINWGYAQVIRQVPETLSSRAITFNLGNAVLRGTAADNIALQPGDQIALFTTAQVAVPIEQRTQVVTVSGEVRYPGTYQLLPGETMPQLIKRVGGLTPQAYIFGTELTRATVRTRQQENLDALIRRLEAQAQAQIGTTLANRGATAADATQTSVMVQQQQQQTRSQIERLKTFKSNGRLAMELDPRAQSLADLPALPLEDGDSILVPSTPGFVSAFGSVNNENVFIYKPGKTVADVVKSAGLTEDAEPAQAFVLRADGSIVSRSDRGWFGIGFDSLSLMPGDILVVPAMMDRETRYSAFMRGAKDWTQLIANFGLGVATFRSLGY